MHYYCFLIISRDMKFFETFSDINKDLMLLKNLNKFMNESSSLMMNCACSVNRVTSKAFREHIFHSVSFQLSWISDIK